MCVGCAPRMGTQGEAVLLSRWGAQTPASAPPKAAWQAGMTQHHTLSCLCHALHTHQFSSHRHRPPAPPPPPPLHLPSALPPPCTPACSHSGSGARLGSPADGAAARGSPSDDAQPGAAGSGGQPGTGPGGRGRGAEDGGGSRRRRAAGSRGTGPVCLWFRRNGAVPPAAHCRANCLGLNRRE